MCVHECSNEKYMKCHGIYTWCAAERNFGTLLVCALALCPFLAPSPHFFSFPHTSAGVWFSFYLAIIYLLYLIYISVLIVDVSCRISFKSFEKFNIFYGCFFPLNSYFAFHLNMREYEYLRQWISIVVCTQCEFIISEIVWRDHDREP